MYLVIDTTKVQESEEALVFVLLLTATTKGQVEASVPLIVLMHPISMLQMFVNFAPEFDMINYIFNED